MFGLIICSLLFIKTENFSAKMGFYDNENGGQHMIIDVIGSLKDVKSVYLMSKTSDKDVSDYVNVADYKQNVRIVKVEKKFDESDTSNDISTSNESSTSDESGTSDENEDLKCQEFYTIYVDMKDVDINPLKTFSFNFELDNNKGFMTCPFHYSEKEHKWVLEYSELDVRN